MNIIKFNVGALFLYCILRCCSISVAESSHAMMMMDMSGDDMLFCRNAPQKPDKPVDVPLPEAFLVNIEAVHYTNQSTIARLSNLQQAITKKTSAVERFEDGVRYQYIFNGTSKTYSFVNDSNTCVAEISTQVLSGNKVNAENDPLLFPNNAAEGWLNNASSIKDILDWATNDKAIFKDDKKDQHEHGIPVEHYYVCKTSGDYVLEIEICVTNQSVKMPFPGMNSIFPIRIDVKRFFNGSKDTNSTPVIEEFIGYRLSSYRNLSDEDIEKAFLPPPGVPCTNVSTQSQTPLPEFPKSFGVYIDFIDESDRRIDAAKFFVDGDADILAVEFTSNDSVIPLAEHALLPSGKYKIVHDFHYGLEYVVEANNDVCHHVSDIPNNASDAALDLSKGRFMVMKNASELLGVTLDNATIYKVGQRLLNSVPTDVWLAYTEEEETSQKQIRRKTIVHEAYFSKADWKIRTGNKESKSPTLLAVKKYEWVETDGKKTPPIKTTRVFHDFVAYTAKSTPWNHFDVTPCLNSSANDSYLVAFGNDTLAHLDENGRVPMEQSLRSEIAAAANVSALRVTNFYFEAVNNTFWAFFVIADRPAANGSQTLHHNESITIKDARALLNKTLMAGAVTAAVAPEGGKYYAVGLQKGSLAAVPPMFKPPVVQQVTERSGYTGSSMAALGICMLLIGGVLGLVLAFFMWKRNRGIAYQIYE